LVSPERRETFASQVQTEYAAIRRAREAQSAGERLLPWTEARARRLVLSWDGVPPPRPSFLGVRCLEEYPLRELVDLIDWTPFFQSWELSGRYPEILSAPETAKAASALFEDAGQLLARIVSERLLSARAVFGFFPANAVGEDIELYTDERRRTVRGVLHTLRQQMAKSGDRPNLALADFVASRESSLADYVGLFAITAGHGLEPLVAGFERDHDDYSAILAKSLADRLAEALAERLHERVRREFWGYAPDERLSNDELIREGYRGIRPAPGYPACPDHSEKATIFALLDATSRAGITLTESFAMLPTASVSGYYFSPPEATYFGVGRIGRDQVEDYARRKGVDTAVAERWLAANLAYER
jgi:5-methyltetrahydrofolate--homocysteine methyltransferase